MPTGRRYKAKMQGWVWRTVRCQHCGCEFAYRLLISATGEGFSWMWLDNSGASGRAQDAVRRDYNNQARHAIGIEPCPECGKYQENMVQKFHNQWIARGVVVLVIALVLTFAYGGILDEPWVDPLVWVIGVPILGFCAWMGFLNDPNANINPQKPRKSQHAVMRRKEFELLAEIIKQKEGKDISIPAWPR